MTIDRDTLNQLDFKKIDNLINHGENSSVEFKLQEAHPDSIAKEITAFANTQGGTILLGVDDAGAVIGIDNSKNWEEWIANIARNNIVPSIHVSYNKIDIKGKYIGIVEVPKGQDKPYQTSRNYYFIRIGSTSRAATQGELMRMFQHAGMFHYDLIGLEKTSIKNLNISQISSYFQRYDIDINEEENLETLLINTDIITSEGNTSVAGLLVFGIHPQKFLMNASISYAHFAGTTLNDDLIDRQVIEGTLDFQIDTALAVITHNIKEPSKIEKAKRVITSKMYPGKVFRELLVNACIHRNYAIYGSRIRILHFQDRIEFISPGRLPNTVTIEKLKSGVSYATNPVILKFMENLRYIDKLGRGIPMVCLEAKKMGFEPFFEETGEEFQVTLPLI
ncbi:MAG: putative DNA binding domain-containing protein [Desulfobacula sp.]|jgi:ATP-dependent DNA helicase RecG|nr:putative DNA binding domain-containing protein [Desulfobacula sp.]